MTAQTRLLEAVRAAPRRYRMPPLPADARAAAAAGVDTALAYAIEAARVGAGEDSAGPAAHELFVHALAALIARAIDPQAGDPALQALLLRQDDVHVAESLELAAQAANDRRRIQALVDAVAHPGKLRQSPAGPSHDALSRVHALARAGEWRALGDALGAIPGLPRSLSDLPGDPALARLVRAADLQGHPTVQRYLALCAAQGPLAGSDAAAQAGRAAARAGDAVEAETLQAFTTIADRLDAGGPACHQAVRGLRPVSGLPRAGGGTKDEWDVALVRRSGDGLADLLLLAECKAAPAAASADWSRLLAGLAHLAQAEPGSECMVATEQGELRISGASLRALAPMEGNPPAQVLYCCSAQELRVSPLAPMARALLLQEPEALAFARELAGGTAPQEASLAPVWLSLARSPRLRAVLQQYETARRTREAMVHPLDLLAAFDAQGRPRNR